MVAGAGQSLNQVEKRKLREFLRRYRDIFVPKGEKMERTTVFKHKIDTGNAKPIRETVQRLPQAKTKETERTTGFCVDYALLNNVTKIESYLLPRIYDTLDVLA
ncbi:uncharacterized protein [Diabrotica undecimpunctata]|uniref:uncharacterized protein n=1 Tax=Diabrotica undecimpunctata TaxID=50387 RepID=UPI003B638CBD